MASFRKKYLNENGAGPHKDVPVASTPVAAALPPLADAPKPADPKDESNPVEKAASSALKARLTEMQQAENVTREPVEPQPQLATEPQQPQHTAEQIIASANIPERAKDWLRKHPEYITDKAKNALVQKMHHVAEYQAGGEFTDRYYEKLENLLGLKQALPNSNVSRQPVQSAAPRQSAPLRAPAGPQVSAPPTREAPSMTTGRPASQPMQLTTEERQLAQMLGLTDAQYGAGKKGMLQEKAGGFHQDG